nr:DsbA family protein [Anaerolineae bacterium]
MTNKTSKATSRRARQRRRSQNQLIAGVSIFAVLVVLGLILLSSRPTTDIQIETDYNDLQQSIDESTIGFGFAIGDPAAPVTMTEFSDFSCSHCRDLSDTVHRLIDEYVRAGVLRVVFKPVSFVNPTYSTPAAQAVVCAAEQGMGWEMHDHIWALYDAAGPGLYTSQQLSDRAKDVGLNMADYSQCFSSVSASTRVQSVLAEASQLGINATPTVFVNGTQVSWRGAQYAYADLKAAIDALIVP